MARLLLFDIDMTLIRGRDPGRGPGRAAIDLAFERVYGVQQASAGVSFDGRTDRGIFSEMIALHAGTHGDAAAAFDAITAAYLAAHLGVAAGPADCIVIGDTPLDIAAAHGAGARALGVATGRSSLAELLACGADWAVADLSSTKSVLEILRSEPSHQPPAPAAAEG